jgi:hypothetical protein
LSETEKATVLLPPQGAAVWYDTLLRLLENRQIQKVDKAFLENQEPKIASHNESKFIAGLKFLGLIDKDGNATEAMSDLSLKGEKRRENLEKVVRKAYVLLFDEVKIKLEDVDSNTLVNTFKTDYRMSINTAEQAARIFVFFAQQAGIPLSRSILDNLSTSLEKSKQLAEIAKKPRGTKKKEEGELGETEEEELQEKGMYVGKLGDNIFIKLRKSNDRNTREKIAKHAKTLIDLYVEGEEEGS